MLLRGRRSLLGMVLLASGALAEETGALVGVVTDGTTGRPAPGAVVTATSPALPGGRTVRADAQGVYRLSQLPPGQYRVQAELEEFEPWPPRAVGVEAGTVARVNLQLTPQGVVASDGPGFVVDTPRPQPVEAERPATATTLAPELLERLPFLRPGAWGVLGVEEALGLVPGAVRDTYGTSLLGAQSPEHRYTVDGVAVNDLGTGLDTSLLPLEFLESVRVETGGVSSLEARGGGAQVRASLRGGGNAFHGSVFTHFTPGLLSPARPAAPGALDTAVLSRQLWNALTVGAQVSGPLVADRLWFAAGVAPSWSRVQAAQTLRAVGPDDVELLPDTRRTLFEDRRSLAFYGKLGFQAAPGHRLDLSVSGQAQDALLPTFRTLGSGVHEPAQMVTSSLRYAGAFLEGRVLVDATLGWFHHGWGQGQPLDPAQAEVPQFLFRNPFLSLADLENASPEAQAACRGPRTCSATAQGPYAIGGPGLMTTAADDRLTARASAGVRFTALGHHLLRAGLEVERSMRELTEAFSGGGRVWQSVNGPAVFDNVFAVLVAPDVAQLLPRASVRPSATSVGVALEERWAVLDLVTVEAGLRYDHDVQYDGAGRAALAFPHQLSPHLGAHWDFTGQGQGRLFASYGRTPQPLPLLYMTFEQPSWPVVGAFRRPTCGGPGGLAQPRCLLDPATRIPNGLGTPSRFLDELGSHNTVDPGLRPGAADEVSAGGEVMVWSVRVGVTYAHRWMAEVVEDVSRDQGASYALANPGAVRTLDALTVEASHAFADGWVARASYTWSSLQGDWNGFFDDTGQLSPGYTRAFDFPVLQRNALGPLAGDRTHAVRVLGARDQDLGHGLSLLVGLGYEGRSGSPLSYLAASAIEGYGRGSVFLLARGAAGRLPWVHSVNLKVGLTLHLAGEQAVRLEVDGLNVFNFGAVTQVDQELTLAAASPSLLRDSLCLDGTPGCVPAVPLNSHFKRPQGPDAYQPPMQWRLSASYAF